MRFPAVIPADFADPMRQGAPASPIAATGHPNLDRLDTAPTLRRSNHQPKLHNCVHDVLPIDYTQPVTKSDHSLSDGWQLSDTG
jgi:hypothetical protein